MLLKLGYWIEIRELTYPSWLMSYYIMLCTEFWGPFKIYFSLVFKSKAQHFRLLG